MDRMLCIVVVLRQHRGTWEAWQATLTGGLAFVLWKREIWYPTRRSGEEKLTNRGCYARRIQLAEGHFSVAIV